jgi:eukaryotic-like serine/threonine-protein kinase
VNRPGHGRANALEGFELEALIGRGASATVWRARPVDRPGEQVALKRLRHRADAGALAREAAVLAALDHPHILRVLDTVHDDDEIALVLELADGGSLAARLADGPMPAAEVVAVGRVLADALGAAHAVGVVHGDVRAANVLRVGDRWCLADLGLAHHVRPVAAGGSPSTTHDVADLAAMLADAVGPAEPSVEGGPTLAARLSALLTAPPRDARGLVAALSVLDEDAPPAASHADPDRSPHPPQDPDADPATDDDPGPDPDLARHADADPDRDVDAEPGVDRDPHPVDLDGPTTTDLRRRPPGAPPARRRRRGLVAAAVVLAVVPVLGARALPRPATAAPPCAPQPPGPAGDFDGDGCPTAVTWADGVAHIDPTGLPGADRPVGAGTTARYGLGRAGDELLVGDWDCDGRDTLGVLHPDGSATLYDGWPANGIPVDGRAGAPDGTCSPAATPARPV